MAILLLGVFTVSASASSNSSVGKSLSYIAQNWIDAHLSNDAEVSEFISIYDENNLYVGDLVSFKCNDTPSGYIILSKAEKGNPIIEWALDGQSVYSRLTTEYQTLKANRAIIKDTEKHDKNIVSFTKNENKKLYTRSFIDYAIKIENEDEALLLTQKNQIKSVSKSTSLTKRPKATESFYDGYIDHNPQGSIKDVRSITYLDAYTTGDFPAIVGSTPKDNCGPTSLTNTVKVYASSRANNQDPLYGLVKSNDYTATYKRLASLSGFRDDNPASMDSLLSGLTKYSKEQGFNCSIDNYWFDNWGDFTRDLKAMKPVLLYTSGKVDGKDVAHSQVVIGYQEFYNGEKYLEIYSGWTTNATFVKYKPSCLPKFNGYCVKIVK